MKAAILSLVTAAALATSAGTADARPPRYSGGYYHYNYRPSYYGGYYRPYYGGYYNYSPGFAFNVGGFGLSVGNSVYPYRSYGTPYYYSRPYYGGYYRGYYGGYRGWRW